jgi:DNA-binding transcriptional LysR family regulator
MKPASNLDWDLLRVFLAVMRSPNLREAAKRLGVSHATIRRRLEVLEADLGLRLFDRRREGLHATAAAAELLDTAEGVERAVHALDRRAAGADPELRGPVRVTAPDALMTELLLPELAAFSERHPQIELHVDLGYELADLGRREADVAIRAMPIGKAPHAELTGRKAASASRAIYGSGDQWIGFWGEERDRAWVKETAFPDLPIRGAFPDPLMQRGAAAAGMGLTLLSCFIADGYLERVTEPEPHFDIWVLVHPDLRRNPRLRVFRDEMVAALKRLEPRLQGANDASDPGR